jgi:CDP-glycerol glycerophosphotransferase (TagB/SpsB family)
VLYAPTFSTANSLHLAGPSIIEALLATGRNVIVKLHDRSAVPDVKHTDGIDWPARLAAFESHPRFTLSTSPDVSPLLAAADVLVTDHSSVGFEFALLDRPVIVFDAPALMERARVAPEKWTLLRSMADVTYSTTELAAAVERAFTAPGRLREKRLEARKLFAYPGEATGRAMTVVYELLDLQPIPAAPHEVVAGVHGKTGGEPTVGQTIAATGR